MTHQTLTADAGEPNVPACPDCTLNQSPMEGNLVTNRKTIKAFTAGTTMKSTILSILLLSATATAQDNNEPCSCSPREYYFKLDLSATCPDLPPPFPPNDVFGAGVKDYTCTIGPEPVLGEKSRLEGEEVSISRSSLPFHSEEDVRKLLDETMGFNDNPPTDDFVIPDIVDPEPVVIDSIQFFELDPDFNVINQDPSYVRDVEFVNGDVFNYTSISSLITTSGKENYSVPGGINMVLRGYNAAGERVRNVFTITFTNECDVPTFDAGDEIGWVVFDSFVPASDETCRSGGIPSTEFPTPSPESEIYGLAKKPTRRPTPSQSKPDSMSMDLNMVYSKFNPAPKVHKMTSPQDFSYQFHQGKVSGKSNKSKSGKSNYSSGGKSGKSTEKPIRSKRSKDEPIRNLRATLDQLDLDRGAKPSKRLR